MVVVADVGRAVGGGPSFGGGQLPHGCFMAYPQAANGKQGAMSCGRCCIFAFLLVVVDSHHNIYRIGSWVLARPLGNTD